MFFPIVFHALFIKFCKFPCDFNLPPISPSLPDQEIIIKDLQVVSLWISFHMECQMTDKQERNFLKSAEH